MNEPTRTTVAAFKAPFGQEIELQDATTEDGVSLMRVRIRERSRFTVFDIDPATADDWGRAMRAWAQSTGALTPDGANDD
jgi:hypothetical protein